MRHIDNDNNKTYQKMKTTRSIIAATVLAAVAIFSGCRKETFVKPLTLVEPNFAQTNKNNGVVHYRLQTTPQSPDNLFQWSVGRMNAVELFFNGSFMTVPPVPLGTSASIHQSVGLGVLTELGALHPRAGSYTSIIFKTRLSGADTGSAVVLAGTYNKSGIMIPVRLIVAQDVILQGEWPSANILLSTAKEHVATFFLDLDGMTSGLDHGLVDQAFQDATPDNEVVISSESNPQLYQAIYQYLLSRGLLKVTFE